MQKTKLVLDQHSVLQGENVIEVWYQNNMIATITGADGAGIRVISKYDITTSVLSTPNLNVKREPQILTVHLGCKY